MNVRLLLPIAALALALAGVSCNKSSQSNRLNGPSSSAPPARPGELKLKWTPGERIVEEFDIDQTELMNRPDQPAPVNQHVTTSQEFSVAVVDAQADGSHWLESECLDADMKIEIDGINSDRNSALAKVFGRLVGSKIQYFLDATNNVERVEGINEFLKRLSAGEMTGVLRSKFNEDYFKQIMIFNQFLPPNPVQPGDTWSAKIQFPRGTLNTYYLAFRGWGMLGKRNCARIEMSGDFKSDPRGMPGPMGTTVTVPEGSVSGGLYFDPEIGAILSGKMDIHMTVLTTMPESARPGAGAGSPQILTNQLAQVISLKVDSLE